VGPEVILVDTNAWIRHLQHADARLATLLREGRVRTCDVVLGELSLGSGLPRDFARDLSALPTLPSPTARETRAFIDRHHRTCRGSGIGWADAQIIVGALKSGAKIYSSDAAVRRVSKRVGIPLA
jgi:predicted nucleic acid-binding protein